MGLQELGLPYASDPAVTRHLAHFLHRHVEALAERPQPRKGRRKAGAGPTAVLFSLTFEWVSNRWKVFGIQLGARSIASGFNNPPPAPAAPPPPPPKK